MRAEQFMYFNNSRAQGEDLASKIIFVAQAIGRGA